MNHGSFQKFNHNEFTSSVIKNVPVDVVVVQCQIDYVWEKS